MNYKSINKYLYCEPRTKLAVTVKLNVDKKLCLLNFNDE